MNVSVLRRKTELLCRHRVTWRERRIPILDVKIFAIKRSFIAVFREELMGEWMIQNKLGVKSSKTEYLMLQKEIKRRKKETDERNKCLPRGTHFHEDILTVNICYISFEKNMLCKTSFQSGVGVIFGSIRRQTCKKCHLYNLRAPHTFYNTHTHMYTTEMDYIKSYLVNVTLLHVTRKNMHRVSAF